MVFIALLLIRIGMTIWRRMLDVEQEYRPNSRGSIVDTAFARQDSKSALIKHEED
jgi:hypothetical protein